MLGLLLNTLTSDHKYSRHNKENFQERIQTELSLKPNTCYQFSIAFLKSTSTAEYFEKRHGSHSLSITEIIDSKRDGYLNV